MSPSESVVSALEEQLFGPAGDVPPNLAPSMIMMMLDMGEGVSDLVFSVGRPAQVEQHGELTAVDVPGVPLLKQEHTAQIARQLIAGNEAALRSLKDQGACDLSYAIPNC